MTAIDDIVVDTIKVRSSKEEGRWVDQRPSFLVAVDVVLSKAPAGREQAVGPTPDLCCLTVD